MLPNIYTKNLKDNKDSHNSHNNHNSNNNMINTATNHIKEINIDSTNIFKNKKPLSSTHKKANNNNSKDRKTSYDFQFQASIQNNGGSGNVEDDSVGIQGINELPKTYSTIENNYNKKHKTSNSINLSNTNYNQGTMYSTKNNLSSVYSYNQTNQTNQTKKDEPYFKPSNSTKINVVKTPIVKKTDSVYDKFFPQNKKEDNKKVESELIKLTQDFNLTSSKHNIKTPNSINFNSSSMNYYAKSNTNLNHLHNNTNSVSPLSNITKESFYSKISNNTQTNSTAPLIVTNSKIPNQIMTSTSKNFKIKYTTPIGSNSTSTDFNNFNQTAQSFNQIHTSKNKFNPSIKENINTNNQNKDDNVLSDGVKIDKKYHFISSLYSNKSYGDILCFGYNTHNGTTRNYNEDRISIHLYIKKPTEYNKKTPWPDVHYFAVLDGHGGSKCVDYLKEKLVKYLISNSSFPEDLEKSITEAVTEIENDFLENIASNPSKTAILDLSGSCVIFLLVINNVSYVVNIGDSRAILVRNNFSETVQITTDHKPENSVEYKRIVASGGDIFK